MSARLNVFLSSVQKELEDERVIVENLLNTDAFLAAHCSPVLYEFEPACQVYLLIVAAQYGTVVGKLSITHAEYRRAKEKKLPVLAFLKGDRKARREEGTETLLRKDRYRPCSRNPVLAQCLSYFHRIEERGSGFRRMRDQMLDHGLDQPLLGTDTGYFQVTFPGPGENLDRILVPETRLTVTPVIEAQLNGRQKKMVALLAAGEKLTSRRCEHEFGITRDTASRDFALLMELRLANRQGCGRSTSYILATKAS